MVRIVRIAVAQCGPIQASEDRHTVVLRLLDLMALACRNKCDIVVFPELALTTFFPRYYEEERSAMNHWFEQGMPNPSVQPLFDYAKQHSTGFYLGYGEHTSKGHHFNTSILVDQQGVICGKYRKVHLPGDSEYNPHKRWQHLEKRYFQPGNLGFPVWRTMGGLMGMCICNDRRWPETFRVMGLQGVELVMLGYNTPTLNSLGNSESADLRMMQHHICMQAGAYQNSCWVVGAAKAGSEDGFELMAGSCIVSPSGEIVARANTNGDELIMHECDLDLCNFYKQTIFDFAAHRRIEHYQKISSQIGVEPPSE